MLEINAQMHQDLMKTAVGVFGLVQDSTSLESVFDINDGLRNSEAMQAATAYLKSVPAMAQLIGDRYIAPQPNLEGLLTLRDHSLGRVYASKMIAEGFNPNFYPEPSVENELDYIRLRVRQTHDIWHAVTGFNTDELGEISLQAFGLAQMHYPSAVLILAAGLISGIKHPQQPESLDAIFKAIVEGYQMGQQAKLFLAQRWEEAWSKPLSEWRAELNVQV
jgi:ubiquinone biosynthesis protein COQ4